MTLKTITKSSNKKLGGCATTYRAGSSGVYGTCPNSCPLKPEDQKGTSQIDLEYLEAVKNGVPEGGVAWTYTHVLNFPVIKTKPEQTCINVSTDTKQTAAYSFQAGMPTVVVVPAQDNAKVDKVQGIRFVRCPAEYQEKITCDNCGGDIPLCARQDRDYIIKFTAHGAQQKKIELRAMNQKQTGGCYGNGGPVRLQWEKTKQATHELSDSEVLTRFVASLPRGTKLRHHVVGDIGLQV